MTVPISAEHTIKFCNDIFSVKNIKAIIDAKKGIKANMNKVTAAVVKLIEYIKPKNAVVKLKDPIIVVLSIFKIFLKKIPSLIKIAANNYGYC